MEDIVSMNTDNSRDSLNFRKTN